MASFLENNDLSGKTIVPFVTHKDSGFGNNIDMIESLAEETAVYPNGWSQPGDNAKQESVRQEAASWARNVLEELGS